MDSQKVINKDCEKVAKTMNDPLELIEFYSDKDNCLRALNRCRKIITSTSSSNKEREVALALAKLIKACCPASIKGLLEAEIFEYGMRISMYSNQG